MRPSHDDLYDAKYYEFIEDTTGDSSPAIVASILRDLSPRSVLDVGCGTGAILAEFARRGIAGKGLERSRAALRFCQARGLDVAKFDIGRSTLRRPAVPFDVVVSTEVAEHLPTVAADAFVNLLTSQGNVVVFTAATPGQGGLDHVNEQPHAYWIAKFRNAGFALDEALTNAWRQEWTGKTADWFSANVMAFRRA
jgi:2-polyprenyl-3-methyl-5-hydroxy-6-metoxy-1,4-benzoquinol methylase